MKRLFVHLRGGLGNQMFQYAAARALAARNGAELVLDTWSGFVRDRQYRRRYELDAFPLRARIAMPLERLPIWLYRLDNRLSTRAQGVIQHRPYGRFLVESEHRYLPEVAEYHSCGAAWMDGYWQSPRYFEDFNTELRQELTPPPPKHERLKELGTTIRNTESLALGIRLYEESRNPAVHAREGRLKTTDDINNALRSITSQLAKPHVFVFCARRSREMDKLRLPETTTFVTQADKYSRTVETLWLLSQCRHHLFTNSTYYWWGAWLSQGAFAADRPQCIVAANNFINVDTVPSDWQQF